MNTRKFCVNCKHHTLVLTNVHRCSQIFNIVTGENEDWACDDARGDQNECGEDARFFDEKD